VRDNTAVRKFLIFVFLVIVVAAGVVIFQSSTPVLTAGSAPAILGQATPVTVHVRDKRGLRTLRAWVEQNGTTYPVAQAADPKPMKDADWNFTAGVQAAPQLKDGKAVLAVEAVSNDVLRRTGQWHADVTVVTRPPSVTVDADRHYLYLGMADLVTFQVAGNYTDAGVRVGNETFRAWPMPGGKAGLFSLFAFAWNMTPDTAPLVFASAGPGDESTGTMVYQFPKNEQPHYTTHDLQVSDAFLNKVINELDPGGTGDPVARFVKINTEMRKANNQTLFDLRTKTADHFLWSEVFQRQPHSQAESTFADVRNYIYHGQKIDQQVHLGYDLAVTEHVGVQASNDGRVVYAAPLGIYGNCVVLDHGYGLMSLYGHMSNIAVHEGDMVKKGQVLGQSGMTGMAAGDHIHFSMMLDGVQIDPKEWWDAHWIEDHIVRRVPMEFSAAAGSAGEAEGAHPARAHRGRRGR
jgi:murein DD-endopeptidase MepM/ murein hydrolase activator NlpD